jgi:hypothetical protein
MFFLRVIKINMIPNYIRPKNLATSEYLGLPGKLTSTGILPDDEVGINLINNDYVKRKLGFTKQINENNMLEFALNDPAEYIHRANQEVSRIGDELATLFNSKMLKHYNQGDTLKEARDKALKYIKIIRDEKFKDYELKFPKQRLKIAGDRFRNLNKVVL